MVMEFKMFFKNEVFIHNMLNNRQPKTLPIINIKIYFIVFISNSSYQYYLAHLLLSKFLLGFTTQLKISLNQWLTFLCMEPFEKPDKSPPKKCNYTHTKCAYLDPKLTTPVVNQLTILPFYFLVLITHQKIDSMEKLKWATALSSDSYSSSLWIYLHYFLRNWYI